LTSGFLDDKIWIVHNISITASRSTSRIALNYSNINIIIKLNITSKCMCLMVMNHGVEAEGYFRISLTMAK